MLEEAEDNYYITVDYLLNLSNRAVEIFESSEIEEKRQLLKLTLQNLRLNGRLVQYDYLKPFDTIAECADRSSWLAGWDDFRTAKWVKLIEDPERFYRQTQQFLTLHA